MPRPHLDVTAPYLEGPGTPFAQMHELASPEDAGKFVDYWAGAGMSSFKAYMNITGAELAAAAEAAHRHGLRITGHLCSVSWPEAIAAGIDDLEHGPVYTDTEFVAGRQPDKCPDGKAQLGSWAGKRVSDPEIAQLIRALVDHRVAVTSTLPVFELIVPDRPPAQRRALNAMSDAARDSSSPTGRSSTRPMRRRESYFGWKWTSSTRLLRPEACCWRARTRPAPGACCRGSAINARSSCWWKRASRRWRPSGSGPATAPGSSVASVRSAPSPTASAPISYSCT